MFSEGILTSVGAAAGNTRYLLTLALALANLSSVLQESGSVGVVAATCDTQMLSPTLLSLPQGEVGVLALIIFPIPIPSGSALGPSEPGIPIFRWSQNHSPKNDIVAVILLFTFTNINTVIVVYVTNIHVLSVADLGKFSMNHLILRGPDQVISVTVLYDSVTREQVKRVLGARKEEQTATQEAGDMGMICGETIHPTSKITSSYSLIFRFKMISFIVICYFLQFNFFL